MMKLKQLEIFDAIMRTGSVTSAAHLLNLSQPSVSTALRHLESQLGFELFKRIKGRLRPSPEAAILYQHVSDVSLRLDGIGRIARDLRGGLSGAVSVAATPTVVMNLLAPAVAEFRIDRPDVQVVIRTLSRFEVVRRVTTGESDFGIIQSSEQVNGLDVEDIVSSRIICIVPKDHSLAALAVVDPIDLEPYPLISFHADTVVGSLIQKAFTASNVVKRVDVQTSFAHTACSFVKDGLGVALFDPLGLNGGSFPDLVQRPFASRIDFAVKLLSAPEKPSSRLGEALMEIVRRRARHIEGGRASGRGSRK